MLRITMAAALWLLPASLYAQDITGTWQGTVHRGQQDQRLVIRIAKPDASAYGAELYSIDQSPDPVPAESVVLTGSNLKLGFSLIGFSYEGKLSPDGTSIEGSANQGGAFPLELKRATKETAWQIDPSPHKAQFVTVDKDTKLEVLDWGGSGRRLVLLAGLDHTAHVFDEFAPKLTSKYRVYGITRRGFGASSHPTTEYSADRLGDDVLAVMDALKLDRPLLVGWSIGGEELSSVGSRHPEKVAGLIYLDGGYCYAYYGPSGGPTCHLTDAAELQRKLQQFFSRPYDPALLKELLETDLPAFERDLREAQKTLFAQFASQAAAPSLDAQIFANGQKYSNIHVPILAIFAAPHDTGPSGGNDPGAQARLDALDEATFGPEIAAFEKGLPTARVVRLPHASHVVFQSNEADVLREMNAFIASLPPAEGGH
jgi:non-heme chloroperoxidase